MKLSELFNVASDQNLAMHTSLNTLRDAIYEDAVAHGLWENTDYTVKECIEAAR